MISKNILVVDDAADWRDLFQSSLKRSKYNVDTAASYQEAMEKLARNLVELVIVDLRLDLADEHNRDGMILLTELNRRGINALVITGYGTAKLKQQANSLEAITFIEKTVIGRSGHKLKKIVNKIFSEIEARAGRRNQLTEAFTRGEATGYPANAAGYPLRESLTESIEAVLTD